MVTVSLQTLQKSLQGLGLATKQWRHRDIEQTPHLITENQSTPPLQLNSEHIFSSAFIQSRNILQNRNRFSGIALHVKNIRELHLAISNYLSIQISIIFCDQKQLFRDMGKGILHHFLLDAFYLGSNLRCYECSISESSLIHCAEDTQLCNLSVRAIQLHLTGILSDNPIQAVKLM